MSQDLCSPLQCNVCLMQKAHDVEYQLNAKSSKSIREKPTQIMNTCNGCNMIRYCGKEHQKMDWPLHQEFCTAMQKIKKAAHIQHPLMLTSTPQSREDMENVVVQLKYLLRQSLGRALEYHEEELTSYPVYCAKCYKLNKVNTICPSCHNQAYCSQQHLREHSEEHAKHCGLMQLYYTPFKTMPQDLELELTLKQGIDDMKHTDMVEALEKSFHIKLPQDPTASLKDYQLFSYAADFSCIGSICYALSHMNMPHKEKEAANFVIFVIGASIESVLWFRDIHCKFFFQQYPQVKHLNLHFIGPDVAEPLKDMIQLEFLNCERTIHYHYYRGLFQTYCQYHKVIPSIIVAFNCGFSEFSQHYNCAPHLSNLNSLESLETNNEHDDATADTWYQGLVEILQTFDTPIVFTSFTKQEADFDFGAVQTAALKQRLKVRIDRIFKVGKNPFHDLRPLRQWYGRDQETFYYRNGYIQAITSKLMT